MAESEKLKELIQISVMQYDLESDKELAVLKLWETILAPIGYFSDIVSPEEIVKGIKFGISDIQAGIAARNGVVNNG